MTFAAPRLFAAALAAAVLLCGQFSASAVAHPGSDSSSARADSPVCLHVATPYPMSPHSGDAHAEEPGLYRWLLVLLLIVVLRQLAAPETRIRFVPLDAERESRGDR